MLPKNRILLYICVSIAITTGLYYLYTKFDIHSLYRDDLRLYIDIAKSIAENKGYKNVYEKYDWQYRATCPPFYPLILSIIYKTFHDFHNTIITFNFLIYILIALLIFKISQILYTKDDIPFLFTILYPINHMVLHYFFHAPIEGFLTALFLLFLLCYLLYIKTNGKKYLYFILILGALIPYTKAFGLAISFSIITFIFLSTKSFKKTFISTLILIPLISFFFYWYLFTGTPGKYITDATFFTTKNFSSLKLNISEVIFYFPFKLLFYNLGIKCIAYLNNIFYKPLLFIGKTTRIDLAGAISILIWIIVVKNIISMIKIKEYMIPLIFFYSILIFVFHTCLQCADVRIVTILIPLFLHHILTSLIHIKHSYIKYPLLIGFIAIYLYTNLSYLFYTGP